MKNTTFAPDICYPDQKMYKTGDLAKYLPNGEIHYIGNIDNQIEIKGLRFSASDVERYILQYPNVNKCTLVTDMDNNDKRFIIAYLVVNDRVSIDKLKMYLKEKLPNYMVPDYFIILDKMPYLTNGKIDKSVLPKPEINKYISQEENHALPKTKLEEQIADIFEKLLSVSNISIDDNFFELGGDSLVAINLQIELLKLDLKVTYSDIFMNPTVRELSRKLSNEKTSTFNKVNENDFIKFANILSNSTNLPSKIDSKEIGNVLITGSTGFLGAHVLDNFLKSEDGKAYCLIRSEPGITLENKLLKKLHYYFGNKYDKYIGNRIIIINGDISEDELGLSKEDIENFSNNIDCVINCAAKVSHYGNYNDYKKINVDGTENLLKLCLKFNKRFYQISTLSVAGNTIPNQSFKDDIIFRESNLFINQSLDNVYVRSKFEAEKLVLEYILKGLDGYILRVGNLMNRFLDSKFQPNVNENAYISRLVSLLNIGCIPDYLTSAYLEFTPIDSCAEAIIKLIENSTSGNRVFHLYDHNHVDIGDFIKVLRTRTSFDIVSNDKFTLRLNNMLKKKDSDNLLSGILRDLDDNQKLSFDTKIKIKSEFSIEYLQKIGFVWPKINENYINNFLDYFHSLGYMNFKEEN